MVKCLDAPMLRGVLAADLAVETVQEQIVQSQQILAHQSAVGVRLPRGWVWSQLIFCYLKWQPSTFKKNVRVPGLRITPPPSASPLYRLGLVRTRTVLLRRNRLRSSRIIAWDRGWLRPPGKALSREGFGLGVSGPVPTQIEAGTHVCRTNKQNQPSQFRHPLKGRLIGGWLPVHMSPSIVYRSQVSKRR